MDYSKLIKIQDSISAKSVVLEIKSQCREYLHDIRGISMIGKLDTTELASALNAVISACRGLEFDMRDVTKGGNIQYGFDDEGDPELSK